MITTCVLLPRHKVLPELNTHNLSLIMTHIPIILCVILPHHKDLPEHKKSNTHTHSQLITHIPIILCMLLPHHKVLSEHKKSNTHTPSQQIKRTHIILCALLPHRKVLPEHKKSSVLLLFPGHLCLECIGPEYGLITVSCALSLIRVLALSTLYCHHCKLCIEFDVGVSSLSSVLSRVSSLYSRVSTLYPLLYSQGVQMQR